MSSKSRAPISELSISVVVHFTNNSKIQPIYIGPIIKSNPIYQIYNTMMDALNSALGSEHEYYFM
jgi:hypothetical protein